MVAPLTECALKTLVSMPESPIACFNHLATVDEVTGRCGFMVAMNSWEFPPLSCFVLSM